MLVGFGGFGLAAPHLGPKRAAARREREARVRSVTQITVAAAALLYGPNRWPCGPALGGSAPENGNHAMLEVESTHGCAIRCGSPPRRMDWKGSPFGIGPKDGYGGLARWATWFKQATFSGRLPRSLIR